MLKFKNKTTLIVLAFLIAASLSIGSLLSDNVSDLSFSNENVGWVGKKPIKNIDFLRYKQYLSIENPNISNKEIVNKIGERYAILQYGRNELNIRIPNKSIVDRIKADKMFHLNGVFDEKIYSSHLNKINLTPLAYETNVKENLLLEELIKIADIRNNSTESEILLSNSLFKILNVEIYEMNYQFQSPIKTSKKEIEAFYKKNPKIFITPLSYDVKISKYTKSKDYIMKKWEDYKKNPETIYDIKQILVNSESDIDVVMSLLKEESFESVARLKSIDASSSKNGGLIKGLKAKELTSDFIKGLKSNKIGGMFVVKSSLGYHLVKKEKVINEDISIKDFEEYFSDFISESFLSDIKNNKIKNESEEVLSFFGESLKSISKNLELKKGSIELINNGYFVEKIEIVKEQPVRILDINNENDYKMINVVYSNQLKLKNAIKMSENIDRDFNPQRHDWIMKSSVKINKNTEIPQELKDEIYTTKIGGKGAVVIGNKYFVFIVKNEVPFNTKEKDFKNIINSIYNFESGFILIKEAKSLYPIKISEKILEK